jgi:hypothetical protein
LFPTLEYERVGTPTTGTSVKMMAIRVVIMPEPGRLAGLLGGLLLLL